MLDAIKLMPGLEPVMNPIETVMVKRSSHIKLALAVLMLVLVLWATGSSVQSLWIAPLVVFALWIGIQFGLGHRRRQLPQ